MPPSTSKPVMDVRPPRPPAPTVPPVAPRKIPTQSATTDNALSATMPHAPIPLAVHQAPADEVPGEVEGHVPAHDPKDRSTDVFAPESAGADTLAPGPQTSTKRNPGPIGAIAGAIIVMAVLAATAIAIYLKV